MNWWKKYGDKVGMGCFQEGPYVQQPHALTYISLHVVYNYFVLNFIESVWVYFHAMLKHSYPNGQFLSTPHVGSLVPRPCPSLRESGSGNGELRKLTLVNGLWLRQSLNSQTCLAVIESVQWNIDIVVGAITVQTGSGVTWKHEAAKGVNWDLHLAYMQFAGGLHAADLLKTWVQGQPKKHVHISCRVHSIQNHDAVYKHEQALW